MSCGVSVAVDCSCSVLQLVMIFAWLRRRRRKRVVSTPFPEEWELHLDALPFFRRLPEAQRGALRDTLRIIVLEKRWEGCGGLEMTDGIRVTIAAQAALLLLGIEHEYYRRVRSVVVYPSTVVVPERGAGAGGLVRTEKTPVLGLAQYRGPVVLAWDAAQYGGKNWEDGRNVVIHEFAHKLDMLDRWADGTPPLEQFPRGKAGLDAWVRIMTQEYEKLTADTDSGRRTLLDKYGATNPAEFFAVASECFFEKPRQLARKHAELYDLLRSYYNQDPARWR